MAEPKNPVTKTKTVRSKAIAEGPNDHMIVKKRNPSKETEIGTAKATEQQPNMSVARQRITTAFSSIALVIALLAFGVSFTVYRSTAAIKSAGAGKLELTLLEKNLNIKIDDQLAMLTKKIITNKKNFLSLQQDFGSLPDPFSLVSGQSAHVPAPTALDDSLNGLVVIEGVAKNKDTVAPISLDMDTPPASQKGLLSDNLQIGLLAATGVWTENLAGRSIDKWVIILEKLQWPGLSFTDRDVILAAGHNPVESRADLLILARLQITGMLQALHQNNESSGLLNKLQASLGALVQLRRVGQSSNRPETIFANFEAALVAANFEMATTAAIDWSSSGFHGLDEWLAKVHKRQQLDLALNNMLVGLLNQALGLR